jgi:hypothetical protein
MIATEINRTIDISVGTTFENIGKFVRGNSEAHEFNITCQNDGVDEDLSGVTCNAHVRNANGQTIVVSGSTAGSVATVVLSGACYAVQGRLTIMINLVEGDVITTVYQAEAAVVPGDSDVFVDPEDIVPSLAQMQALSIALEALKTYLESGVEVTEGGTAGQVLAKASNDDYDTEWATVATAAQGAKADNAVLFSAQTLSEAYQAQACKNISAGRTNRNLLINGDFSCNQRDASPYSPASSDYTVDMWLAWLDTTVTVVSGGITLSTAGGSNNNYMFAQSIYDYTKYKGKVMTISVSAGTVTGDAVGLFYYDGVAMNGTTIVSDAVTQYSFVVSESATQLLIGISRTLGDTQSVTLYKAKLENAAYSTIIFDTGHGAAADLLECQRYYLPEIGRMAIGYILSGGTVAEMFVPTPVQMRITPTLEAVALDNAILGTGDTVIGVSGVTATAVMANGIRFQATLASTASETTTVVLAATRFNAHAE